MKLSLSNGIFSGYTLDDNIATVKKLGFNNLEFNMKCVKEEDENAVYSIKKLIEKFELSCLTLHAATLPVNSEDEIPKAVYYCKVSTNFACILSAPIMVVHSNISRRLPVYQRKAFLEKIFREVKPYARHLRVKLAIENLSHDSKSFGENVTEIQEILSIIDNNIGLTVDFCHAKTTGQAFNLIEIYKNRLLNIHISDDGHKHFEDKKPMLEAFLLKLKKYGYKGPLTIELNQKCTLKNILKTKKILEKILDPV